MSLTIQTIWELGIFPNVIKATTKSQVNMPMFPGDIVAIKIIELNSLKSKKLEQLLFQQIQILKKLNHPSVLKCYQIFTSNRNCYIITQICNQGNLQNHLKIKKTFDQNEANPIIKDVYEGLIYLAQNNIVHRDLKSANIFLNNGRAKIADFGFAKEISHNFKDLNIGSPLYMAPQGILHNVYGPKTEVWALGILVYELFHGASPYIYCKTEDQLKRSVTIPLNWNQLRTDLSQDIKEFILTCLEVNEQKRASIEQLTNLGYIRRLHSLDTKLQVQKFDVRSPSKSVHLGSNINNQSSERHVQPQQQRVNNNFRTQNDGIMSRDFSVNKQNDRQMVFKSVDMRGANRHNTYDFQSPKRSSVLGQGNLKFNSPSRRHEPITSVRPLPNQNNFMSNPPNMLSLVNQSLNTKSFQFQQQQGQQNMIVFPVQQKQKPLQFLGEDNCREVSQTRPTSTFKNQNMQQQKQQQRNFDTTIGYNSMNGFYSMHNQQGEGGQKVQFNIQQKSQSQSQHNSNSNNNNNTNSNNNNSQSNNNNNSQSNNNNNTNSNNNNNTNSNSNLILAQSKRNPDTSINSTTSYMFKSKLNFKQAIFFIHHCRLIFKFLYLYKETCYFQEQIYLRLFQYLLSVLTELNKIAQNNGVVADGERAGLKVKKFREVNIEYLSKYIKQLDQCNYSVVVETISKGNIAQVNLIMKQLYNKFNEDIALIKPRGSLTLAEQNLIIMGHLCIVMIGSLKQIQVVVESGNFNQLLQFKQIQTVLNTPKQEFTIASYKSYHQMFIF